MQIRLGYELVYDCRQPTPMLLMLNVHYTRVADMVVPDSLTTNPPIPIRGYHDSFGNWCSRILLPAGRAHLYANGIINDTRKPDVVAREPPVAGHRVDDDGRVRVPQVRAIVHVVDRGRQVERGHGSSWGLMCARPSQVT